MHARDRGRVGGGCRCRERAAGIGSPDEGLFGAGAYVFDVSAVLVTGTGVGNVGTMTFRRPYTVGRATVSSLEVVEAPAGRGSEPACMSLVGQQCRDAAISGAHLP